LREEYPENLSQTVIDYVQTHLEDFGRIFTRQILPSLEENNIHLYYGDNIREEHKETYGLFFYQEYYLFFNPYS
jgi:hypothetical protein